MSGLTGRGQVASQELRIRSLESRLSSLERAQNPQASAPFARGPLPSVENLTVEQTVGSLLVTFDPVNLPTLKYYEVQYSNSSSFSFSDRTTTQHTSVNISPGTGVGTTTYYIRARVVDTSDRIGPWGPTVTKIPGQAATTDLADSAVNSNKLASGAATKFYEETVSSSALFTGSDEGTWVEIIDITGIVVVGQNPGNSLVGINAFFDAQIVDFLNGVNSIVSGAGPTFTYRIVRDKGLAGETVIHTSGGQTISSAGYGIGASPSVFDEVPAGTYTYTVEAKWDDLVYTEGTARFNGSNIIDSSGTKWRDFLSSSHEIQLPSLDATWWDISLISSDTALTITAAHGLGTTAYVAYNTRWTSSLAPIPVTNLTQATIQVAEYRR